MLEDGRLLVLAAAAGLAVSGVVRSRLSGSRGVIRHRVRVPYVQVRFIHKISPNEKDLGETLALPDKSEGWYPKGLFLDAECRIVDLGYVRTLWKKLYLDQPLGRVFNVRVERDPKGEKPPSILLFNPSLWSPWHAIVLEIHDWEDDPQKAGSRGVVLPGRSGRTSETGPHRIGWLRSAATLRLAEVWWNPTSERVVVDPYEYPIGLESYGVNAIWEKGARYLASAVSSEAAKSVLTFERRRESSAHKKRMGTTLNHTPDGPPTKAGK